RRRSRFEVEDFLADRDTATRRFAGRTENAEWQILEGKFRVLVCALDKAAPALVVRGIDHVAGIPVLRLVPSPKSGPALRASSPSLEGGGSGGAERFGARRLAGWRASLNKRIVPGSPHPARQGAGSRCFASAFLALRTAAQPPMPPPSGEGDDA